MKKNLHTFIMGSLTLFAIYLYTISASAIPPKFQIKESLSLKPDSEENLALNYLNRLRIGAGLVPFSLNQQLRQAAKNHAYYLIEHHTYGHIEDENLSGYTGLYASSRILYTGYPIKLVIENVSNNNRRAKESLDGLMAAIYHRFAFLSFKADEIGIGINQNQQHKEETAFVYTISAKSLRKLCTDTNVSKKYSSYSDICINKKNKISTTRFNKALYHNNKKNQPFISYPFNEQYDVPPAFFNELPDPLPDYDVSGFPISLSFNPSLFSDVKLLTFELFDHQGKKITSVRKHDYKSDPNQRLQKTEFVLFPLKRLEWDSSYSVKVTAIVHGKKFEKKWSFHTRSFKEPFYKVSKEHPPYNLRKGEATVFYFPPHTATELLHDLSYTKEYDIEFIDPNTITITALEANGCCTLTLGKHHLKLNIHN